MKALNEPIARCAIREDNCTHGQSVHNRPADCLGVFEEPGLDGFVFPWLHNGKWLVLTALNTSLPRRNGAGVFTAGLTT